MFAVLHRRSVAVIATLALSLTVGAGPALAHFCSRDFGPGNGQNAANGQAWFTGEDYMELAAQEPCINSELLAEFIAAHPNNLFMGPGLLAGGTLNNGNTPKKVAYIPFEVFAGCGEDE
jgi:hypothetical protein